MKLDFTGLDKIANIASKESLQKKKEEVRGNIPKEDLKPLTGENTKSSETEARKIQEEYQKIQEAYKDYQSNIRSAGELRADILKGVKEGESVYSLFLKAVECISNMTGDSLFYRQIRDDVIAIHGEGYKEEVPLSWKIKTTEDRLKMLKESYSREMNDDSKHRIDTAIHRHEHRLKEYKGLLIT